MNKLFSNNGIPTPAEYVYPIGVKHVASKLQQTHEDASFAAAYAVDPLAQCMRDGDSIHVQLCRMREIQRVARAGQMEESKTCTLN